MNVRAKFRVTEKTNRAAYTSGGAPTCGVVLSAVNSERKENATWAKYTPSGQLTMQIDNPDAYAAFELGKEYFLDFTPAED